MTGHGTSRGIYFKSIFLTFHLKNKPANTLYDIEIYIFFLQTDTCHNEYSPHNFLLYLLNQKIKICVDFCFWSLDGWRTITRLNAFGYSDGNKEKGGVVPRGHLCSGGGEDCHVRMPVGVPGKGHTEALGSGWWLLRWSPLYLPAHQPLTQGRHLQMCTLGS